MTDTYENADDSRDAENATGDRDVENANGPWDEASMDAYRFTIEPGRDPSLSIVEALSTCLECDPTDLDPLYHDVDPEMLDRLVTDSDLLEFRFVSNDVVVTVRGDDSVVFEPANG